LKTNEFKGILVSNPVFEKLPRIRRTYAQIRRSKKRAKHLTAEMAWAETATHKIEDKRYV